ncbi:membrane protein of unknown function [Nitrospira defluvii]|jgi:hypothetical protein|uniref:Uncharacterized protein n=1 Tax=Nitrospira defluvii TaxID=330214 RepID=D8PHA7_9BACT|nr:membrane protein of unknown function [Nitrospira defluvii]
MPYRSSPGLILIVSAFAFVLGLWRLATSGRWRLFAVVIGAFFGYAALLYAIFLIPDARLRIWTALVVVIGFPAWIMAGPIVYGISSRPPEQLLGETSTNPSARSIRYRGAIALFLGVTAWCYGVFDSDLSRQLELVVLGVALYGCVLGGYWLLSGRRLA